MTATAPRITRDATRDFRLVLRTRWVLDERVSDLQQTLGFRLTGRGTTDAGDLIVAWTFTDFARTVDPPDPDPTTPPNGLTPPPLHAEILVAIDAHGVPSLVNAPEGTDEEVLQETLAVVLAGAGGALPDLADGATEEDLRERPCDVREEMSSREAVDAGVLLRRSGTTIARECRGRVVDRGVAAVETLLDVDDGLPVRSEFLWTLDPELFARDPDGGHATAEPDVLRHLSAPSGAVRFHGVLFRDDARASPTSFAWSPRARLSRLRWAALAFEEARTWPEDGVDPLRLVREADAVAREAAARTEPDRDSLSMDALLARTFVLQRAAYLDRDFADEDDRLFDEDIDAEDAHDLNVARHVPLPEELEPLLERCPERALHALIELADHACDTIGELSEDFEDECLAAHVRLDRWTEIAWRRNPIGLWVRAAHAKQGLRRAVTQLRKGRATAADRALRESIDLQLATLSARELVLFDAPMELFESVAVATEIATALRARSTLVPLYRAVAQGLREALQRTEPGTSGHAVLPVLAARLEQALDDIEHRRPGPTADELRDTARTAFLGGLGIRDPDDLAR